MTNVIKFNTEVQVEETPKAIKDLFTLEKDTEGKPVINAYELYEAFDLKEEYRKWFSSTKRKLNLIEDVDYIRVSENIRQENTTHFLTMRAAKKIAMTKPGAIGELIRNYFLDIEEDYISYITGRKAFTEDNVQESLDNVIELQEGIVAHFAVGKNTWRKDTDRVMKRLGTMNKRDYAGIRKEAYEKLEERAGVNLSTRLNNIKKRLMKNGVAPSTIDKKNNMDVIAQDDKLIQTYIEVVTALANEYKVEVSA